MRQKRIDAKPILLAALKGEPIPEGRRLALPYCRFIFAHYLREKCKNLEEIGKVLNKNHSTVSYYLQKYDEEYKYNPEFRELADWFNLIKEEV